MQLGPRKILEILDGHWQKDKFLDTMRQGGMGLEGIAGILIEIMKQTTDNRARLAAIKLTLEIAGLKAEKADTEINIFLNELKIMPQKQMEEFVKTGKITIANKLLENKEIVQ